MEDKQHIKTPEGVAKLLKELWLRHKAGLQQPENNVFWVDFPPLTEEERAVFRGKKGAELKATKEKDDKPEDLYGAWI